VFAFVEGAQRKAPFFFFVGLFDCVFALLVQYCCLLNNILFKQNENVAVCVQSGYFTVDFFNSQNIGSLVFFETPQFLK
jgi:hypothetical protein